jgi:photosystem II stability/assembly factor-like uncharacterized protein
MLFVRSFLAGLILGLAPPVDVSAATSPKEPAFQENFYGVQIQDERAWIVGYYGTILHSRDRGLTWEIQPSPTRNALFRVQFLNSDKGWISGSYGTILHTADGGRNWSSQPTGTTEHLLGLASNDSEIWAVGSRGTILHTQDQGRVWLNSSSAEDLTFSSVSFADSTRGWIAGEFGVIFQTHDGGKTWVRQKSPIEVSFASGESRNLFALLFPDLKNGFAFGLDGIILKAAGGSRWEVVRQKETANHSAGANHLFAAAAFNGRLWAVGERGTLLRSELDGLSWRAAGAQTPRVSLNGIAFGKDGWGLIVGNRGVILRTENAGQTWNRLRIMTREQEKGLSHLP